MAKVTNWKVYDMEESILASGYPFLAEMQDENEKDFACHKIERAISGGENNGRHLKRAITLANTKGGGHDNFLKGILVAFDLTFSNKAWVEMQRYQFCQIVSSQSTMHRIKTMDVEKCCNQYVTAEALEVLKAAQQDYQMELCGSLETPEEIFRKCIYNIPSGFELTARMTTNYMCLKNIYAQRRKHRLPDWQVFCDFVEELPLAKELICGVANGNN